MAGINRRQPGCECSGRLQTLARSLSLSLPFPLICAHSFPPTLSPPAEDKHMHHTIFLSSSLPRRMTPPSRSLYL